MNARRIFWGRSLAQAVAKAARYHRVAPDELAWRRYEKRHGFVRHQRAVLIEVDPAALLRAPDTVGAPPPTTPDAPTATRASSNPAPSGASPSPRPARAPSRAQKIVANRNEELFDAPDDESEQAALEAIGRLSRFAGLDVRAAITRRADRLEIELVPSAGTAGSEVGVELLDELEHLLPKAILSLSSRRVRATIECAGQRAARAEELRAVATACAGRVRASGQSESLGPLPPGERRMIHQLFEGDAGVATESLGDGYLKKIQIVPRG